MANLKDIRKRIMSVKSTQQITRAMKMVSAAKFKKAQNAILKIRPYSNKLKEVIGQLAESIDDLSRNPYYQQREIRNVLLVIVTGDKGLCGSFNSSIIRETLREYDYLVHNNSGCRVDFITIGKKGYDYFHKGGYNVLESYFTLSDHAPYETVEKIAQGVLDRFITKEYDLIKFVFNTFKNPAVYLPTTEQFLPVASKAEENETSDKSVSYYIFEPSEDKIIEALIPTSLKINFYRMILESNASEQGARMTAMDKATDNAEELLNQYRLTYNKVRQSTITNEILEIVSGANALNA